FACVTLAASGLSILVAAAVLRLWIFRSRASAIYAVNLLFLDVLLILLPLILAWLVLFKRRQTSGWSPLDRAASASTRIALILLGLTASLVVADVRFVRFDVFADGKLPQRQLVVAGTGSSRRVRAVAPIYR